jgi:hypothetical protein
MDEPTRERFQAAVERKKDEARERSHQHAPTGTLPEDTPGGVDGDQHSLISDSRTSQDVRSPRDKNSGHGKKTADKWNQ